MWRSLRFWAPWRKFASLGLKKSCILTNECFFSKVNLSPFLHSTPEHPPWCELFLTPVLCWYCPVRKLKKKTHTIWQKKIKKPSEYLALLGQQTGVETNAFSKFTPRELIQDLVLFRGRSVLRTSRSSVRKTTMFGFGVLSFGKKY